MYDIVIIRNGEISIKKKNKVDFENALVKNLKYRLHKNKYLKVQKVNGRVEISLNKQDAIDTINKVKDIFGVVSLSPAIVEENGYEKLFLGIKHSK